MAKLIYMMNMSLDGYTQDEHGRFDYAAPKDEEVHTWILEYVSSFRTLLYGRRMYETMVYWETAHTEPNQTQSELNFARAWQAADKIVYSRTLAEPRSARTRIERDFNPDAVRQLKAKAAGDISIAGPELAAQAVQAGLVDEFQMRICPVIVGGGKRYFPSGVRLNLDLSKRKGFVMGKSSCAMPSAERVRTALQAKRLPETRYSKVARSIQKA